MKNKLIYFGIAILLIGIVGAGVSISNQITLDEDLVDVLVEKGMDKPIVTNIKDYSGQRHFDIEGGRTNLKVDKINCSEYNITYETITRFNKTSKSYYNITYEIDRVCLTWVNLTDAELNASIEEFVKKDLEWTAQKLLERKVRLESEVKINETMKFEVS